MHKNLTPTRSFLSVFTLQMHKKRSPTEWVVYTNVSCTFPREDLCEYNALALSLLLLNGVCVCLCGPKSCFFSPLSPFVDLMTSSSTKQLQRRSQKIKKKRDRSLSFSLFHEKALFEVRDAFSLLLEIVESKKKKRKKIQNLREERLPTRARAQEEREKKTSEFERIELFSSSRCVLSLFFAFARRRGRNFARRIERERGQRFAILLTLLREREKKSNNKFSLIRSPRARSKTRPKAKKERTRTWWRQYFFFSTQTRYLKMLRASQRESCNCLLSCFARKFWRLPSF